MNQDQKKQERLLRLAGWLHYRHRFVTPERGSAYTEVHFTRTDLSTVRTFDVYSGGDSSAGEKAFHRDIQDLESFGIDVRWDASRQEWTSRILPFTDDEYRALAVAAVSVVIEDGSLTSEGFHIPGAGVSVEGADVIVGFSPFVDALVNAIRTRTPATIVHRGRTRSIDPWHLFMSDGRWYLMAYDRVVEDERVFALDAVESVEVSSSPTGFEIPNRDISAVADRAMDPNRWSDADPVSVVVEVDGRIATRAEEMLGASLIGDAARSGWVRLECEVRNIEGFIHRLWGLRARAVVVEPEEVRVLVVDALEEMA